MDAADLNGDGIIDDPAPPPVRSWIGPLQMAIIGRMVPGLPSAPIIRMAWGFRFCHDLATTDRAGRIRLSNHYDGL